METEVGDYVIVHEFLHFRVPNHGKLWKSLITAHLGSYEELEEQLKFEAQGAQKIRAKRDDTGRVSCGLTRGW